jgi:hypothetical protein
MRATLKRLHSPDVWDLEHFQPPARNNFGFLLQLMVGPSDTAGEDSLDVVVCTPDWLKHRYQLTDIIDARHHLIVFEYDYPRLTSFLKEYCAKCSGDTWEDIALKLGRLARWEYEDFKPRPPQK